MMADQRKYVFRSFLGVNYERVGDLSVLYIKDKYIYERAGQLISVFGVAVNLEYFTLSNIKCRLLRYLHQS